MKHLTCSKSAFLKLTTENARVLAHAILIHFKKQTSPVVDTLSQADLVELILNLRAVVSDDEWKFVELMTLRVLKGKHPLPERLNPGNLLTHITQPATKVELKAAYHGFEPYEM